MLIIGGKACLAKCQSIRKYNLETEKWGDVSDEQGKAFSVVKFNTEFGKRAQATDGNNMGSFCCASTFEYIILMNGTRKENYSKMGKSSKITGWGTGNFLPIIDKMDSRVKVINILVDNDAPLEEQSKVIAKYINSLKENNDCKKIHVLGMSKCGCMAVAMLKYLNDNNLDKLNIMAYSAPYLGTIFASPILLYKKADEIIDSIPRPLSDKLIPLLNRIKLQEMEENNENGIAHFIKNIHWNVFSKSHMDYDISDAKENGVPKKYESRYDSKFLKELFSAETLDMLSKVKFTNITTYCTENTLRKALESKDFNIAMLYLADKTIFAEKISDGMVELSSSKYIEEVCKEKGINIGKLEIPDGHHAISGDPEIIRRVVEDLIMHKDRNIERE